MIDAKVKISILGCGWLGLPLAQHLINQGYILKGATTSISKVKKLEKLGIAPFVINIDNKQSNIDDFLVSDVLIICITSKNIDGFINLLQHIEGSSIKNVLFISSTSVYDNLNDVVTEETPVKDVALVAIENLLKNSDKFKTTILRFGGLFGYDRKPGNFFRKQSSMRNPNGHINLIHQDDCIRIINAIISQNAWGEIFNACTDSHPLRKVFYSKEILKVGNQIPEINEEDQSVYKIINSDKLKQHLNYSFKYADLMRIP